MNLLEIIVIQVFRKTNNRNKNFISYWASLVAQLVKNVPAIWFNSWVGKIPWKREWLSIPVELPGEFHWTV